MKTDQLFAILEKFENTDIAEFSLKTEGYELKLKKESKPAGLASPAVTSPSADQGAASQGAVSIPVYTEKQLAGAIQSGQFQMLKDQENSAPVLDEGSFSEITAKVVGVFYAASSPGAKPYITVGSKIKKGDVIGIIEAMKLMNEIESPISGTVKKIHVDNEELVEFGQVLVSVEED